MTDTKEMIAQAALKIIFGPKGRKLTVTNIVEECQITRQAFYYHFSSVPAMLEWMMDSKSQEIESALDSASTLEEKLKMLFMFAQVMKPYIERTIGSGYRNEVTSIIKKSASKFVRTHAERRPSFLTLEKEEQDIYVRIYSYIIFGFIFSWGEETGKSQDKICEILSKIADSFDLY